MGKRRELPAWSEDDARHLSPAYRARVDRTIDLLQDIAAALKPSGRGAAAPPGTIKLKERRR